MYRRQWAQKVLKHVFELIYTAHAGVRSRSLTLTLELTIHHLRAKQHYTEVSLKRLILSFSISLARSLFIILYFWLSQMHTHSLANHSTPQHISVALAHKDKYKLFCWHFDLCFCERRHR